MYMCYVFIYFSLNALSVTDFPHNSISSFSHSNIFDLTPAWETLTISIAINLSSTHYNQWIIQQEHLLLVVTIRAPAFNRLHWTEICR